MIQINKAILHVLDLASGLTVASARTIGEDNAAATDYLARHIEKAFASATIQRGQLAPGSAFLTAAEGYLTGGVDFVDYSQSIAQSVYDLLCRSDKAQPTDVVLCDFAEDGRRGIALFLFYNKAAFTHYVHQEEDGTAWCDIIRHAALLPGAQQKVDSFAILDASTGEVYFQDRKVQLDGQDTQILPHHLLHCTAQPSSRDALKIVEKAAKEVAVANGQNVTAAVTKAKAYVGEVVGVSGKVEPDELAKEIFADSRDMQQAFAEEAGRAGLKETVKVNTAYAARKSRTHKIKTDTGIELSIPVEYFENREFVEFINNPDGSIAIQLKNIGEIIN